MADSLAEYKARAQQALGGYLPGGYEQAYRQRAMARFGEELPAAQAMLQGMQTGETSQALAAQRLGMGQSAAEQAMIAASGASKAPGGIANPLAARQAMFAGGAQASDIAQRGAMQRAAEIAGAREAAIAAELRQATYGQALEQEEMRRRLMMQQAQQQYIREQMAREAGEREREQMVAQGILGAATSVAGAGMQMGAGGPPKAPGA